MKRRSNLTFHAICLLAVLGLLSACAPAAQPGTPPAAQTSPGKQAPEATLAPSRSDAKPAAASTTPKPQAGTAKYGGSLKTRSHGDAGNWDVDQTGNSMELQCYQQAYNNLIQYDALDPTVSKVTPDLAEKWEISSDGKTWTFQLAKNVKWHDGTPFNSADVKFSLERKAFPPKGVVSSRQSMWDAVDSVEAPDANTIVVKLKFVDSGMIDSFTSAWNVILPKHIIEKQGDMKKTIMGTGPFKLKSYNPGVVYVYEKNKDYFKSGLPYLDEVRVYIIQDTSTLLAAFLTGRVDVWNVHTAEMYPPQAEAVKKQRPDLVVNGPRPLPYVIYFNVTKKPFDDIRVRQAINEALDRDAYIGNQASAGVVGGFSMPGSEWALPKEELAKLPGYGPDKQARLEKAKKLLADSGYPRAFNFTITSFPGAAHGQESAVIIQEMLKKAGIEVDFDLAPSGVQSAKRGRGEFVSYVTAHSQPSLDPSGMFGSYIVSWGGRNYTLRKNQKIDDLFTKQRSLVDVQQRKPVVAEMEKETIIDSAWILLMWPNEYWARWPYVKNYIFPVNHLHVNGRMEVAWLDK